MTRPSIAVAAPTERNERWLVVALLTVGVIIAYTDRINLSSALPEIRRSFPLSSEASGILLSAFFWAYTVLQTPAGWMVDRFGVKWPYAAGLFLWSAVSAATALVNSLDGLIAARILLGIGEAIVTPASMHYIRKNFAEHERGLPIGIFMSGTKYGPAIGAPTHGLSCSGVRVEMDVCAERSPLLALAGSMAALCQERRQRRVGARKEPASRESVSWRAILSTPVMWGTCIATFCYMYFVYFCMTWMPTYFKERYGLSLTASGWFTFMSFGGMATIAILSGWAADRLIARGRNPVTVRKGFTMVGFVLAFSEIFGAFSSSTAMTLFLAVFSLTGLGLATANYWALTQTLTPASCLCPCGRRAEHRCEPSGHRGPMDYGGSRAKTGSFNAPLMAIGFWLVVGIGCYLFLVREGYALR